MTAAYGVNAEHDGSFVVIAEFVVRSGAMGSFLALAFDDAQHSLHDEPGCLQFDVVIGTDLPDAVLFYEVYRSRQAFDDHLATPHLARFRAAFPDLVEVERPVRFLKRLNPAG